MKKLLQSGLIVFCVIVELLSTTATALPVAITTQSVVAATYVPILASCATSELPAIEFVALEPAVSASSSVKDDTGTPTVPVSSFTDDDALTELTYLFALTTETATAAATPATSSDVSTSDTWCK